MKRSILAGLIASAALLAATAQAEEVQTYEKRSVEVQTGAAVPTPPPAPTQQHRVETQNETETNSATGEVKQETKREESHVIQQPATPPPAVVHERTVEKHVEDDD